MSKPQRPQLTRVVLDILKRHRPSVVELGRLVSELDGVSHVSIVVGEVDVDTETVKMTIEGTNLDYEEIEKAIKRFGATIQSIDEVIYSSGR